MPSNHALNDASFYQRQMLLKEIGTTGQQKLKEARVLVLGAGGLGHPVASYLAAAGVGHLSICDHDRVEVSNLHRQILFTPNDIGDPKAEVLAQRVRQQNPLIEVNALSEAITPANAARHLESIHLIVDCCDNFATKFLLHDAAYLYSKDLIQGSIYQMEGQLQTFPYRTQGRHQGCLRCLWTEMPRPDCVGSCTQAGVIGAVPGVLGGLQAMEAIKLICGIGEIQSTATTTLNLLTLQTDRLKWIKKKHCVLCSDAPRITAINEQAYEHQPDYELSELDPKDFILIDLRGTEERQQTPTQHPSKHLPYDDYEHWKDQIHPTQNTLFICRKGIRSANIVQRFRSQGHKHCFSLKGGLESIKI